MHKHSPSYPSFNFFVYTKTQKAKYADITSFSLLLRWFQSSGCGLLFTLDDYPLGKELPEGMGLWGELLFLCEFTSCFWIPNSQDSQLIHHWRGEEKTQLEGKVCTSVRAEQESAGASLFTPCFCSCVLVGRSVWCQPRSQSRARVSCLHIQGQLREMPTETPVLPLSSVSL